MSKTKRPSSFSTSLLAKHPVFSQFSQFSQQQNDKTPYIFFVIPPGKDSEDCKELNLGEMFNDAKDHFLNVKWIKDEECKDQELQDDGNVFIFDPFGSPGFDYLQGKLSKTPRVEILSPTVLRQVFCDPQQSTFEARDCPIYTLAMKGMIVSLSGFNKNDKDELERLVRLMNGSFSPSLTKAVTHVVTANAFTTKCIKANKEQIPVMIEDWIRQVWKDNHSIPVVASDPRYVKYICPVFYNVNICMSQITLVKKNILKSGIEKHGGKCYSELVKAVTDILVVPNSTGEKYKFALKWNLKCVTPEWIENSIEKGHIVPPSDYCPADTSKPGSRNTGLLTSTPAHSMMPDWNMTRCSVILDEEKEIVDASKNNFTRTEIDRHQETMLQLRSATEIGNTGYLDGCLIYLVEYDKCDELKREINKSGAVRLDQLNERVTHVIVSGQKLPKSVQIKLNELESTPFIVTIDWVTQSAKDGNPADEELFRFEPAATLCEETENTHPNHSISSHIGRVSVTRLENHPQGAISIGAVNNLDKSQLINTKTTISTRRTSSGPHSSSSKDNTFTSNGNGVTKDTSGGSKSITKDTRNSNEGDRTDLTQEDASTYDTTNGNDASSPGLFVGITFVIILSDAEQTYMESLILENGGSLVKGDADVAILQPVCNSIDKNKADKSCTKYWLFECLEYNALDIDTVFYHIPLPSFKKMENIFKDTVVALSQYAGFELEYIQEVVTALGSRYQDAFTKRVVGENLKSTHLICKSMESKKAKAAKKWSVPVVVAQWVIDSFNERRRMIEDKYDPSQVSTADATSVYMPTPKRRQNTSGNGDNTSVRSMYPPSTQKGHPKTVFSTNEKNNDHEGNNLDDAHQKPSVQVDVNKPSTSKYLKPDTNNEEFRAPSSLPRKAHVVPVPQAANKDSNQHTPFDHVPPNPQGISKKSNNEEDSFLKSLPDVPPQEEIDAKMAEFKAMFPYSDESFERMLDEAKQNGIDLDAVSPFTSFEARRLENPDPDSPLLLGLPRHESRALKEQFEIALNRTPYNQKLMKTPTSTPLSEIVRRFNAMQKANDTSPSASPRHASTPKSDLRRVATMNSFSSFSQGNASLPVDQDESEDVHVINPLAGIRKLSKKRPSEGSPEEKETKRARQSSDNNSDTDDTPINSISPNENNLLTKPEDHDMSSDKPTSAKKLNRMEILANLIAEDTKAGGDDKGDSPIKRRSGENNMLLPCEEVQEEIERPHLSWVENDDDKKKSTVKKHLSKPRIPTANEPGPSTSVVTEPKPEEETKKRSSRLRKASSTVSKEDVQGRVTRQTRARSRSRARDEDSAPLGHKPMKNKEGKKKPVTFPVDLPNNPVFSLSSLEAKDKNAAIKIIQHLGGSISKASTFDIDTHALVASKLMRSEKVLGSIGSGKFILKVEYLTKCEEAGYFLQIDEEFSWHESNISDEKERELARAYVGWLKIQMNNKNIQPMKGMTFYILEQSPARAKAYERLILACGGEVTENIKTATCVIKDDANTTPVPTNVKAENPVYLNSLILTVPES